MRDMRMTQTEWDEAPDRVREYVLRKEPHNVPWAPDPNAGPWWEAVVAYALMGLFILVALLVVAAFCIAWPTGG